MSSLSITNLNLEIKRGQALFDAIQQPDFYKSLETLNVNWGSGLINSKSKLTELFREYRFLEKSKNKLTASGQLFLSRIIVDFESEIVEKSTIDKYTIIEKIRIGKNSCTFLAKHSFLGNKVVLKFLRPGSAENISEALKVIMKGGVVPNLVQPIDYLRTNINDTFSQEIEVECIVFPYVEGISLREFLNDDRKPLNAHSILAFIKQVGKVLNYLESVDAYHGDLHEENIIVEAKSSGVLKFNVIDVSFGVTGSLTSSICKSNDLAYFRQHIWNFLSTQQQFLSKMSIRKYLGAEIFSMISLIMSSEKMQFKEIISLFDRNLEYEKYIKNKSAFLEEKFKSPGSFKLQRYEEITDQKIALKLFVPFPELLDNIKSFSNVLISGNRGSGKSTYLAAIAFFPRVNQPLVDFKEVFGVYFPCRQGEFRLLSSDMVNYENLGFSRVKHVLVIKIVRRALEAIADGLEEQKLSIPEDFDKLKKFLSGFIKNEEIISLDLDVVPEIRNLISVMVRIEMKELDNLFKSEECISEFLKDERSLLEFFKIVQLSFKELVNTKFHLLFDDAGTPNIPEETQRIINDFIISSNSVFCVKLSTEKYSYQFETTQLKQLENGHDYYGYDLTSLFYPGSKTFGLSHEKLEDYFEKIIRKRLQYFNYKSADIIEYLGDDIAKLESLVNSLASGRRNAYYAGWSMVWKIASGNPRNLLELISEIFSVGNIDSESDPYIVSQRDQDRAIRAVSEKRLRSLAQISGVVILGKEKISRGSRLFDITSAVGSIFRIYLKAERGKDRKDQYLAIERNDTSELTSVSEEILVDLIKYGVFDESRLDFARDDRVKKPIYILNRIYCPVFGISYRRDQHLRLSRAKFEEMLLSPKIFVNQGTKRLRALSDENLKGQNNLFNNLNYE